METTSRIRFILGWPWKKRNVLSFFLKDHRVGDPRTSPERDFQRVGASKAKLCPNCFVTRRVELRDNQKTALTLTKPGVVNALLRRNIWLKIFGNTSMKELID